MQPEEEGFTFVDKRHAASSDQADAGSSHVEDRSAGSAEEAEEFDEPGMGPTGPLHRLTMRDRFLMCIDILNQGAWIAMGLVADPATQQIEKDLAGAREAIDAVAFLAERVQSQLDDSTRRELLGLVNDLRLNFVRQANR